MMTLALALAAGVLATVVLAWWRQERITYQPPPPPWDDPGDVVRRRYEAADGQPLFAFLIGPDRLDAPLLIAFHGNADLAVWQIEWAREVSRRSGWRVMLAEYRGYYGLPGTPTYLGVQHDSRAAWRHAHETLGALPERTAFFGHSLGSAVAAELAAEVQPAALLLQSPFTSARDMARIVVAPPIVAVWRWISRVHYHTADRVAELDRPVHVAHGTQDFIIPTRMGREVHQRAKRPGRLLLVPGAGHNDVAAVGGERYWEWIERALKGIGYQVSGIRETGS